MGSGSNNGLLESRSADSAVSSPWEDAARLLDPRAVLGGDTDAHPAAQVLALLRNHNIPTEEIVELAKTRIQARTPRLHGFVPLYLTNHCDSGCKMCAMRVGNSKLVREFAGRKAIEEQLRILRDNEGVMGVGLLTGEFHGSYTRLTNAFLVGWAIRTSLDMGFQRVYFNIGSMTREEIGVLSDWFDRSEPVRMCVFQESYHHSTYARFMGSDAALPKADFEKRVQSFDHWLDAGFRCVNPGILVGLRDDPAAEVASLVAHVVSLVERGADVDISLPRLRPAQGMRNASGVDDDAYLRMIAAVALVRPEQRVVLTTRESETFQRRAIAICGVFSPGSPDVAPYRPDAPARNAPETSQFSVADIRRPRDIFLSLKSQGYDVEDFSEDLAQRWVGR